MAKREDDSGNLKCYECKQFFPKAALGTYFSKGQLKTNLFCPPCMRKRSIFYAMRRLWNRKGREACGIRIEEIEELLQNSRDALETLERLAEEQ